MVSSTLVEVVPTEIILLPLSVWVQKNSIKMVKMQPEINRIKAKFFGDADTIADEESKLYKRYKYNCISYSQLSSWLIFYFIKLLLFISLSCCSFSIFII